MNKDKLISLIIRKQTYKDTKPYLNDLLNLKEQSVKSSLQAIREILTTDYNAEAKLYAVRYLKDAFERANPSFINQVEKDILPILVNISNDQHDEKSVMKYAGSSYTKSEELSKFKAIVSSLFRMVKECIIKWAEWIPDAGRKFIHAFNEIKKKSPALDFEWKYFRPENEQLFKTYCEKNGIKLNSANPKPNLSKVEEKKKPKDPLSAAVEQSLAKVKTAATEKELLKIENDFNEAINNYLENAEDFQEDFVQESFDQFQKLKKEIGNRIKQSTQKMKQSAAPAGEPFKEKSVKKTEGSASKSKEQSRPEASMPQKVEQPTEKLQKKASKEPKKEISNQSEKRQSQFAKVEVPLKQSSSKKQIDIKLEIKQTETLPPREVKPQKKKTQQLLPIFTKEQKRRANEEEVKSPRAKAKEPLKQKTLPQEPKKTNFILNQQLNPRSSKGHTSPKRGPIKFDEQQSPFSSQKPSIAREQSKKFSKQTVRESNSFKKQIKINDVSVQSQRVDFSDEESSEFSEDNRLEARNFKKKPHLTPIKQETQRTPIEEKSESKSPPPVKSSRFKEEEKITTKENKVAPLRFIQQHRQSKSPPLVKGSHIEEQSFASRQKKGGVAHKLMQENKHLMEKYEKVKQELEFEKQEKLKIVKQKQNLEKQLRTKAENEERLIKKLKGSIPIEDYHKLRQQFQDERQKRQTLIKQNLKMRNMNDTLIEQLNETKCRLKVNSQTDKYRPKANESQEKVMKNPVSSSKAIVSAPIIKEEIDPDYIKNLTHSSNLHRWLSKGNISLFKRNILSLSQVVYRDEYLSVMAKSSVYTQNNEQFLAMTMTFQFKSLRQVKPQIRYKNCQELDLWSKPLTGQQDLYTQQLAIRLHSNPLKIMKVELKIIQVIDITFLLPVIYLNFLREQEFSAEQFEEIFTLKSEQLLKSKITQWNSQLIKQPSDLQRLFKNSVLSGDKLRFCLSEGISDQIFMFQFQLLRNNKYLLRILPIPYSESMITKGKQLLQNLTFLLS